MGLERYLGNVKWVRMLQAMTSREAINVTR
jgi:hypothetical protein